MWSVSMSRLPAHPNLFRGSSAFSRAIAAEQVSQRMLRIASRELTRC